MQAISIEYQDFLDYDRIKSLTELHYQEITTDKALKKLSPYLAIYQALANDKRMMCLYAYSGDCCSMKNGCRRYPFLQVHYEPLIIFPILGQFDGSERLNAL